MSLPSELLAHRSKSNSQMSDETSSSSSSEASGDEESSSEDESCTDESEDPGSPAPTNSYLHDPWLLQNREEGNVSQSQTSNSQTEFSKMSQDSANRSSSEDSSSISSSDSSDNDVDEQPSSSEEVVRKPETKSSKKKDVPEWERIPEVYGLRRSSRQRKEPTRLVVNDEYSDEESHHKRSRKSRKRKDSSGVSRLSDSSDEDSNEYETTSTRKVRSRHPTGRASKLTQLRAKLQGRKIKNSRGKQIRSSGKRSKRRTESALSDQSSSDDNRPIRASSRIQRNNKISYKENDSTQETDSDEVVEMTEWNGVEDDGSEAIEKIMDCRVGRLGATGGKTTAYACAEEGDPNKDFDPQEDEGETQYLIKWKGWAHPHNTWESEATLQAQKVRGMKRFENYVKRKEEIDLWLRAASAEDREYYYCQSEMNRNVVTNYCKVDRIIARSANRNANNLWDYEVKWCGLPYSECTWEEESLLKDFQSEIDAFEMRQDNPCVPKRDCKVLRQRPRFVPMTRQPEWLKGLKLRDYQLMGVNWLAHSWCKGNSVILADEMGLGKTIQSITFFSYLYHAHELYGLFLIIVPLSTMTAWQTEFQTWAPYMNVIVYMGDQTSRAKIREVEWMFPNKRYKFNAVLTSYEILLKDKAFLGSHSWVVIAVDEAHRLKNDDSLLYKSLKEFKSDHRLLITGTPLQNSLKELWALLHFIMPEKFESWADFETAHAQNRDSGYASLHKVLQPYLLRRVKKDVEKSLPSKVEQILRVQMSSLQKQYYKWLLTKNYTALSRGSRGGFSSFCNIIMELKKCCNHAYLVKPPEQEFVEKDRLLQNILRNSGKMVLLDKLLLRLKENGHRVLIFSQMVRMLDILQDYLISRRLQFQRLDGSVASDKRRRALDHFNAAGSEDFCFLLSTRAGGLGINLATADTVIIFDSDWNPMNDLQAQARAHRIGQKNQVNIYRLVCAGSVEEDIIERAKKKMVLDHLVIQRMDTSGKTVLFKNTTPSSTTNNPFNKEELTAILKFGAEELFQEADGEDKEPECDIDEILRRAETRQDQTEPSHADDLLSAFKVATFNLDEDEEEKPETSKDWDDIIPEKDRAKVAEENRQRQEAELYLPRRVRKKIKINTGSDSENSDSNTSEEDDDVVDDPGSRKRGRAARSGMREGDDYVRGFTTAEVRRFVRSYRKFGDPLSRLDAIARDAELSEQSEADLRRLGSQLHEKLHSMAAAANKLAADNQETKEDGAKHGRGRGPSFRLAGVSVSVKTTLACSDDLHPLVAVMPKDPEERKNFRLQIPIKPMWQWDCKWGVEDDSKLLLGIYEYGMGSWDHIQSDPSLNLEKKILRPNGEKPQPKQLQSRCEYLIKLLRKAQDQNHPGVSMPSTNPLPRKRVGQASREAKTSASAEVKNKRKSRKIKSKAVVDAVNSDLDDPIAAGAVPASDHHSVDVNGKDHEPEANEKKKRRKRKANDDGQVSHPLGSNDGNAVKEKKRRKTKDPSTTAKQTKASKGPVHITVKSEPVPVATDEFSAELDSEAFRDCKERLRPVKRALKQLDRPPAAAEGCEEQVKNEHTRRCLLQIGDRVIECLREFHDPQEIKTLRRNLWIFVSKFTEHNAEKLHRMYKIAIKRRDFERRNKSEKFHKSAETKEGKKHEDHKTDRSNQNYSVHKSRKIQNKVAKKQSHSPSRDGSVEQRVSTVMTSPGKDKSRRHEPSTTEAKSNERSSSGSRLQTSPPQKGPEDRYPHDERDSWRRSRAASPSSEYRSRDTYAPRNRSPFNDARVPPPGRSPPDSRMYNRDHDFPDRHMRDRRSPPRHRPFQPERYDRWRHQDYRGSPPPPDYRGPAPGRDWDVRHPPPPRGYSPPHAHYPYHQRSPSRRSPHPEYRMQPQHTRRRLEHYPHPEGRGSNSSRYGHYGGSPVGMSPNAYSPPLSEKSLPSGISRLEKT